jgi:transcriptional regulator with XRE-family HTH domain
MLRMHSNFTSPTTLAHIATSIRLARKAQKLSQTELGIAAGLSRMPVYRIEAGHDVSLRTLLSILSALNLGLNIQALPKGPPDTQTLQNAFAHLHAEDAE